MKRTEEQLVRGTAAIWAIPKSKWRIQREQEDDPDKQVLPYDLQIRTDNSWEEGAVKLHEAEVSMILPGDIDVLRAAIATLREAKIKEQEKFNERMQQLENQISALLALEHIPE